MNRKLSTLLLLPLLLPIVFSDCKKPGKADELAPETETNNESNATARLTLSSASNPCPHAPDYGDSIIYVQPTNNGNYSIDPINNVGIKGTYFAWPEGLDIKKNSGTITVTKSETGQRYYVGFVPKGTTDTCVSQLILAGVTYVDSVYVLSSNDSLAAPIYNANPLNGPVCDISDDTDYPDNNANGNNRCVFDDDVPGEKANDKKLRVRTKSGVINLKKSMADGLFGSNPVNGDSKKIKIKYRLNDGSKKAKQGITVQVVYYRKASDIPPGLIKEVRDKRANLMSFSTVSEKPRPPLLIIAGYAN